ncbi:TPA: metallophosphoesterase, partial [Candidatus Bipolaricaulota bacterium]|nr:metallophosphoesterase [Candidatus Bipolaricaulota bacterium]
MLIGAVADTHDNLTLLRQALTLLKERGAELVLHAGDFVSPFVALPFQEAGLR